MNQLQFKNSTEGAFDIIEAQGKQLLELYRRFQKLGIGASKAFTRVVRDELGTDICNSSELKKYKVRLDDWFVEGFHRPITLEVTNETTELADVPPYHIALNVESEDAQSLINSLTVLMSHLNETIKDFKTVSDPLQSVNKILDHAAAIQSIKSNGVDHEVEQIEAEEITQTAKREKLSAGFSLSLPIGEMIDRAVEEYIAGMKIDEMIKREAAKLTPTQIVLNDIPVRTLYGRTHAQFQELLEIVHRERLAFISGPAGTGKTTLAENVAKALDMEFGHISCTAGMSEAHLLGRMTAHGDYLESEFVRIYENGGIFLFDEVDAADPNTLLVINSALANGYLSVPNRAGKQRAAKHENFICICAANTWGTGSIEFAGRAKLDEAFLDRFTGSKLFVDYDEALERSIAEEALNEYSAILHIRRRTRELKVRRTVSTRAVSAMSRAIRSGKSFNSFLDTFFLGWTNEERSKVTEGMNYANS